MLSSAPDIHILDTLYVLFKVSLGRRILERQTRTHRTDTHSDLSSLECRSTLFPLS